MKMILIIILIAFVFIIFTGCTAKENVTVPEAEKQQLSSETEKPEVSSVTEGQSKEAEKELVLPDGFPKDFPIYPGAEIWQSSVISEGRYCIKWQTADNIQKVVEFYGLELPKAGYEWEKTINCLEYQYFKDPDSYSQLTIIDRKSPQFNKELTGDTQIVYSGD
ncbi:MAG: hypothetical protein AB1510_09110 [Bacillota bacterium]